MAKSRAKNIVLAHGRVGIKSTVLGGREINIEQSLEQQLKGFYHPDAAVLIREYRGSYKAYVAKGKKKTTNQEKTK